MAKRKAKVATKFLYKQCDCAGPSSGPRIIISERRHNRSTGECIEIGVTEVRMACDLCDEPWRATRRLLRSKRK